MFINELYSSSLIMLDATIDSVNAQRIMKAKLIIHENASWSSMSIRTTLLLLLAILSFSLTQCRIYSGQTFLSNTIVERSCLGDYLAFNGNLYIASRNDTVVFQTVTPVDGSAVLQFQNDGAFRRLIGFGIFVLILRSVGNFVVASQGRGVVWHANFSDETRGPFVGDLQADLVRPFTLKRGLALTKTAKKIRILLSETDPEWLLGPLVLR